MNSRIRIGTRGSDLALWQARHVAGLLGADRTEIIIIKTQGDRIQNVSFDKMEGKGFFTKEIEEALLEKKIDLAVHSLKDLPTEEVSGLTVTAIPARENPSDILLVRKECYNQGNYLPLFDGAKVGTSSLRRAAQLRHERPGLTLEPLRGNVPTRVRKLQEKAFDAIIIASAGLRRLGINPPELIAHPLPFSFFLPAPAQGALAIQVRSDDKELQAACSSLNHPDTARAVLAERAFLKHFGGGCHVPLGAFAYVSGGEIRLSGVIASVDGKELLRQAVSGSDPDATGSELARLLKEQGAEKLL